MKKQVLTPEAFAENEKQQGERYALKYNKGNNVFIGLFEVMCLPVNHENGCAAGIAVFDRLQCEIDSQDITGNALRLLTKKGANVGIIPAERAILGCHLISVGNTLYASVEYAGYEAEIPVIIVALCMK